MVILRLGVFKASVIKHMITAFCFPSSQSKKMPGITVIESDISFFIINLDSQIFWGMKHQKNIKDSSSESLQVYFLTQLQRLINLAKWLADFDADLMNLTKILDKTYVYCIRRTKSDKKLRSRRRLTVRQLTWHWLSGYFAQYPLFLVKFSASFATFLF